MYRTCLGINPDERAPGYERFTLRPRPGGGLTWAKGSYRSIRGLIASEWQVGADGTTFAFTIPANSTATVYLPAADAARVTEGGTPAAEAAGVRFLRVDDGAAVFEVGSGTYRFLVKP
jgi:alpha-L-rhamnosidase